MTTAEPLAPLDDPEYRPLHPPVDGIVPDVVSRWGPRSQLRWFWRFHRQIAPMLGAAWARFHCNSVQHRGQCCSSCMGDLDVGYCDWDLPRDQLHPTEDERCCCYAIECV